MMQHPPCGCHECGKRRPPDKRRPPQQGVLLNKIVCCDRRLIPSLCTELCLCDLPRCAKPPFTLLMVQQSGAQPWWTPLETHGNRFSLRVCIPVCCQVKDACGQLHHATSVVEVDANLTPNCPVSECWRHSIVIVPCVRLCSPPVCSDDSCFHVKLEISLEIYMTRPEPCAMRAPAPPCPELPLYPPPCKPSTPPCWQQCPASPGPCEWPKQG
ncbi:MAG: hypothetical protein PHY12_14705 [Eubacteriales bacterium]|nr:hypothetical protein [Eubacteriales bacterium]